MIELIVRYYQENPNLFKITLIVLILSVVIGIGVIIAYKAVRKKRQQNESKTKAIDELSESAPTPSYDDPTERSLSEVKTARPEEEPIAKVETEQAGDNAAVEEKPAEKPAPVKEPTAEKPDKNTNEKPAEKPAEKPSEEKDNDATQQKHRGKWIITETDGKYSAALTAPNGEVLLRSETYTSLSGIKSGIETITKNILKDNFAYAIDKKGKYFFKIHSSATRLLCVSEMSGTRSMCESAIASVKKYAESAEIIFDKTDNA